MLLKKIGAKNYFMALLILLGASIIIIVLAFLLTAFVPDAPGKIPYSYEIASSCQFEPWEFEVNNLSVSFPEGGIIVNINRSNNYRSDLLLGEAVFSLNGKEIRPEETGGLFLILEYAYFDQLRGDNIFVPIEDQHLLAYIEDVVDRQTGIPTIWRDTVPMNFHRDEGLAYFYFINPEGEPILPPEGNYSFVTLAGSFLFYILFVIVMLLALTIFSPDHRYSRYWMHLGRTSPGTYSLLLAALSAVIVAAGHVLISMFNLSQYYIAAGYIVAALLLIIAYRSGKIDYLDFGLRRDRLKNGYLLALVAAILFIAISRGIPSGFYLDGYNSIISLAFKFFLIALPGELIWRGYIQAALSRRFGVTKGLLLMSLLVALVHYTGIMATEPWMAAYPYTYLELLVLVPGTAVILGYLYLRTENILACALMHTLIIWLPHIILY